MPKMYPENVYVQHHDEIAALKNAGQMTNIGNQLDIFDDKHGLKRDNLARAQYRHWRSVETGVPELLLPEDRKLLGI